MINNAGNGNLKEEEKDSLESEEDTSIEKLLLPEISFIKCIQNAKGS